jgi:hypothetical protein
MNTAAFAVIALVALACVADTEGECCCLRGATTPSDVTTGCALASLIAVTISSMLVFHDQQLSSSTLLI